ncbi:hypothetical protein RHMOL_Rhmol01G0287700 [Rhododendron molle]|uniref:Uncharacterized protein n=1 Tax=Rhododendron molle TaxID=49168 RepID=A0ACC0Q726_RHOML|nr:hypothetical protein RHMOL_Rhmol01G0287700 [Rhododendron molle]
MDPRYTGEMLRHLEKQNEHLMDAYRSMSHELHKLQGDRWWRSVVVSLYNGVEELGRCGISFWAALFGWKDMGGGSVFSRVVCGRRRFRLHILLFFLNVDRDATVVDHLGVLVVWDVAESLRLGGEAWGLEVVEEEMLMRKFYELMSAQSPARKNEEESSTLPDDGRNGQSGALIPACNNEPFGQSSASLIPVCSDEPIGKSSALTPVSGNEQEIMGDQVQQIIPYNL